MSFREDALKERIANIQPKMAEIRQITEKADREGRPMTEPEQKRYDEVMSEARAVVDEKKQLRQVDFVREFAKELSDNVIGGMDGGGFGGSGAGDKTRRILR